MKARIAVAGAALFMASLGLGAQTYPFPQNAVYPFGILPAGRSHADAQTAYDQWYQGYVTAVQPGGYRRVLWDDNASTVSEGIGYGLLLAANFNDRALFDDLVRYFRLHKNPNGLMVWRLNADGSPYQGNSSASDGDEDIALGLVAAHRQWGSGGAINYLQEATALIGNIMSHDVNLSTFALKGGDAWPTGPVNPSYLAPAYYRVFFEVTQDGRWISVLNKSYQILAAAAHPTTGLLPDWCAESGAPDPDRGHGYTYDAARTPWRLALDYVWNGAPEAQALTEKLTAFAQGIGTPKIKDGYCLDGTLLGQYHNNTFVGPFGAGAMASSAGHQAFCDGAYLENRSLTPTTYFNSSLKALTLFLQTGNFFNPCVSCGTPPPPPTAPTWLRTTAVSASQIDLQWQDNSSNEAGFRVERKQGCCGPWVLIMTTGPNATTFSSTGLACNTSYAYHVWAYNAGGSSASTNEAATTTFSCP